MLCQDKGDAPSSASGAAAGFSTKGFVGVGTETVTEPCIESSTDLDMYLMFYIDDEGSRVYTMEVFDSTPHQIAY